MTGPVNSPDKDRPDREGAISGCAEPDGRTRMDRIRNTAASDGPDGSAGKRLNLERKEVGIWGSKESYHAWTFWAAGSSKEST